MLNPGFIDSQHGEIFPIAIPRPRYPFRFELAATEHPFDPLTGSRKLKPFTPRSSESVCFVGWQNAEGQCGLSNLPGEPVYRDLDRSGAMSAGQFLHTLSVAANGEVASNLDRNFPYDRISPSTAERRLRMSSNERSSGGHRLTANNRHARVMESDSQSTGASAMVSRSFKRRSADTKDRLKVVPLDSVGHQKVIDLAFSPVWRPY